MHDLLRAKVFAALVLANCFTVSLCAQDEEKNNKAKGVVVSQLIEKARKNNNWKIAIVTGEQEQIVFMSISQSTNPTNEIGAETHLFDQAILVVEGRAQAILDGKASEVKNGDLIFVPKGTLHNVVNLEKDKDLKIISFYSATDIPKDAVYKTKNDQPE